MVSRKAHKRPAPLQHEMAVRGSNRGLWAPLPSWAESRASLTDPPTSVQTSNHHPSTLITRTDDHIHADTWLNSYLPVKKLERPADLCSGVTYDRLVPLARPGIIRWKPPTAHISGGRMYL